MATGQNGSDRWTLAVDEVANCPARVPAYVFVSGVSWKGGVEGEGKGKGRGMEAALYTVVIAH